jgi:nucleotide-binding universal stress UspA family protein
VESPTLTIREIVLLAEEEVKKWFDEVKAAANKNEIQFRTEFIASKGFVLDYGEEQNIDLIVVGTKRQVWYYKNVAWNVASGLVTCALCPFLVIK